MIRFKRICAVASLAVVGFVIGLTQTAQAQCPNGTCPLAAHNGTVVTTAAQTPVANTVTTNAMPTTVAQPVDFDSVNSGGYISGGSIPFGPTFIGGWFNCFSYPNVVSSNVQFAPVKYEASSPTSSSCSGGACKVR